MSRSPHQPRGQWILWPSACCDSAPLQPEIPPRTSGFTLSTLLENGAASRVTVGVQIHAKANTRFAHARQQIFTNRICKTLNWFYRWAPALISGCWLNRPVRPPTACCACLVGKRAGYCFAGCAWKVGTAAIHRESAESAVARFAARLSCSCQSFEPVCTWCTVRRLPLVCTNHPCRSSYTHTHIFIQIVRMPMWVIFLPTPKPQVEKFQF